MRACLVVACAIAATTVALGSTLAAQQQQPRLQQRPADVIALDTLIARASAYAQAYELQFSRIVGRERYDQTLLRGSRPATRPIESEVYFLGIDEERAWLTIRNVMRVNGQRVANSRERIESAIADTSQSGRQRLRRLADEGARYNLGDVLRNFNDPALALTFVDNARRHRFAFGRGTDDTVNGIPVHRLTFNETVRPTIIRNAYERQDLPARGTLFVDDEGAIWRTELRVDVPGAAMATIRVTYRHDDKLGMLVPAVMEEDYRGSSSSEQSVTLVHCRAEYSDYRRFETSGRLLLD